MKSLRLRRTVLAVLFILLPGVVGLMKAMAQSDLQYIDLGLPSGTLWAICNVGASAPEDYGDYFAWGETQPKETYDWASYQHCMGGTNTLTKYCSNSSNGYNGFTDDLITLLPEDDAATANWGPEWRTPTKEEFDELYNSTTSVWTTRNGVNGRLFTAENGNSIFLPAAGYRYNSGLSFAGSYGYYWSSSLRTDGPTDGWNLYFGASSSNVNYSTRRNGRSIRPVRSTLQNSSLVTATANPVEGGTVSGDGTYSLGDDCTLIATPNEGYTFINWTENGTMVSTDPTYLFTVTGDRDLVANFGNYLSSLSDDFDDGDINADYWLSFGPDVVEEGGLLKMTQNVTDANVGLLSVPMTPAPNNQIVVERRFFLHKSYEYYYGGFAFEFNGETGVHGRQMHIDAYDATVSNDYGVDYIGIVYCHTNWEQKYGIYVEAGIGSEIQGIRICDAVFETWLTEKVVLDLTAGTLSYYLDGAYVTTIDIPNLAALQVNYFTTIYSPWGYWTGHYHYMDYININSDQNVYYTINASADPDEVGTVSGGGEFLLGQTCTLTATPNEGYVFVNWTENGEVVSADSTYTFTVLADRELVANFAEWVYCSNLVFNGDFELGNTGFTSSYSYGNTGSYNHYYVGHSILEMWPWSVWSDPEEPDPGYPGDHTSGEGLFMIVDGALQNNSLVWSQTVAVTPNTDYEFSAWFMTDNIGYIKFEINGISGPDMTTPEDRWVWEQQSMTWNSGPYTEATLKIINRYAQSGGYDWCVDDIFFGPLSQGALPGVFSVSQNTKVRFSQGNLQYQASTNTWHFADHQWDFMGSANSNISSTYDGWIDLFGWGASGYDHGAVCYQPWSTSQNNQDYNVYGGTAYNLYDQTGQADWGYNAIDNGSNKENIGWRTMTIEEWTYLLETRNTPSGIRYAKAKVNNIDGLLILPDDWEADTYNLNNTNTGTASFNSNTISLTDWTDVLEPASVVFLPKNGYRGGTNWYGSRGDYWASSCINESTAAGLFFENSNLSLTISHNRSDGKSLRLVRYAQNYSFTINAIPSPAEGGHVDGSGTYLYGETCTLTAITNEDYYFVNWTKNGTVVSTQPNYRFVANADGDYVAHFRPKPVNLVTAMYDPDPDDNQSPNVKVCWDMGLSMLENFENGYYTNYLWQYNSWVITNNNPYEGYCCAKSNNNGINNSTSYLQVTLVIPNDGQMSFWSMISSESNYDYGRFYIDGQEMGAWSGNGSWEQHTYPVTAGQHTFKWSYSKDYSVSHYDDCFYVDNINFINSPRGNRAANHFLVYRDIYPGSNYPVLIADNVTDTCYVDTAWTAVNEGWYRFGVKAVYTESDTNSLCVSNMSWSNGILRAYPHTITATAHPEAGGSVNGAGDYVLGTECTLTAVPNENWLFVNWTENGTEVSTETTYTFTVTTERNLVANFTTLYNITATSLPEEGGTIAGTGAHYYNTECTLTATANEDYYFVNWTHDDDVVSVRPDFTFVVSGEDHYVAHFSPKAVGVVTALYDPDPDDSQSPYVRVYWDRDYSMREDFESGNFYHLGWEPNGWVVTENNPYEGSYCMRSDNHSHNSASNIQVTISVPGNRQMSFWSRISSESRYDYGRFYIDGQQMGAWSGEGSWEKHDYDITAGEHTFKWEYTKDGSVHSYDDCFYVDEISFVSSAKEDRAANHFWIYRDTYPSSGTPELLANNVTDTTYVDANWSPLSEGWYRYGVKAIYSESDDNSLYVSNLIWSNIILRAYPHAITATADPAMGGTIDGTGDHVLGSVCTLTATANENWLFVNWMENGEVVSTDPTYLFTVTGERDLVANFIPIQNTAFEPGWSWYSTYVELAGINGLETIKEGLGDNGVMIKSQTNGFIAYDGGQWMGSLNAVNNESMYLINVSAPCSVVFIGEEAHPAQHPITLAHGWTWIGYPSVIPTDINTALSNLTPQDGDVIKIQDAFAQYADGMGWTGGLNTLDPGLGLMYHSLKSQSVSFVYAEGAKNGELKKNITPEGNHFVPELNAYPFNMSVMAVVELDNQELRDRRYELAAFSGDECRGSAQLQYVEALDRYLAFVAVAGDEASLLRWRLYDSETGKTYANVDEMMFEADAIMGGVKHPVTLRFNSGTANTDEWFLHTELWPNPVKANETFHINLPSDIRQGLRVEVVNALGVVVDAVKMTGESVTLKAPEVPGLYLVRITMDNGVRHGYKLIVK